MTIETKYSIGDKVWVIINSRAVIVEVFMIFTKVVKDRINTEYSFFDESMKYSERLVFPTKEALIESL